VTRYALSIVAACVPFAFALVRAVTTGRDVATEAFVDGNGRPTTND
jgi:hypothetical protein